jgi:hypothetical protein
LIQELMALAANDPGILNTPMERMSLSSFWISLGEQSRRLPFLWTFDLKMIDVIGESPPFGLDACREHRFMGLAWLHILLVNHRQDAKTVFDGITDFFRHEAVFDPEQPIPDDLTGIMAPSNIFWETESVALNPPWESFWRKALAFGMDLLQPGIGADTGRSDQEFDGKLAELRRDIHLALFQADMAAAPAEATGPGRDDRSIAAIIDDILRRWPNEPEGGTYLTAEAPSVPPASVIPASPDKDGDVEETIILANGLGDNGVPPLKAEKAPETSGRPAAAPDDMEETVVIRRPPETESDDLEKTMVMHAPPVPSGDENDELEKTVVMRPSQTAPLQSETDRPGPEPAIDRQEKTVVITRPSSPPEQLEKTVVIGVPAHVSTGKKPPEREDAAPASQTGTVDDLDKTVVITPHGAAAGPKTTEPDVLKKDMNGEDELEKTVIIDPRQLNNRKPKP